MYNPSIYSQGLLSLANRLHVQSPKYIQIQEELKRANSGEYGEHYISTLLKTIPNVHVLHNLFIHQQQIDFLILSESGCVVLEVKNIKGRLRFIQNPRQLVRIQEDGTEEIFQSPESQLEQNVAVVRALLNQHGIELPIYYAIVFPFHNTFFDEVGTTPIVIGKDLLNFLRKLEQKSRLIDPQRVAKLFANNSNPWHRFPLCAHYNIPIGDILHGTQCPHCKAIPMTRLLRRWRCNDCGTIDHTAHVKALEDYRMLISDTISTKQAVQFLGLRNRYEAIRILNEHALEKIGNTRNTKYKLPLQIVK